VPASSRKIRGRDPMTRVEAPPRRGWALRNLAWVLFLLMLAAFTAGRLVGPRVPDDQQKRWCVVNVHMTALLGVSLNCDAPEFMRVAAHPSALLETTTPMQSRPGMPIAAWLIALPLQPIASLVPRLVAKPERADIDPGRIAGALQSFGPDYVAYVALNLLILCCSFHLFRRIYRAHQPVDQPDTVAVVAVSCATLMIATYPTTNYLLSPHSQLFNTLVPMLALVFAIRADAGALADIRFAATVGAIVGFGQTAYALFLVITMAVLLFAGVHAVRDRRAGAKLVLLRNAGIVVAMSVAPVIAWYSFLHFGIGQFHYHELQDDKSVAWMLIALHQDTAHFVAELNRRAGFQLRGVISLLPMIAVMAVVISGFLIAAAAVLGRDNIVLLIREVRRTVGIAVLVGLMFFGFYVCVGQFQVRLDSAALPPIVTALGVIATTLAGCLPRTWRRWFGGACATVALVAFVLAVTEGPHAMGQWFD
jgi:hypothetical protein